MWRILPWVALAAFGQTPVVGDLHTVSIHVDGVESYNAAFRLLSEDFGWPVIYGKPLIAEDGARRNYAGIWAGHVVLEICGPYPKEFAAGDRPTRLHGLTFRPYESPEKSAAELRGREVAFHGPVSWSPSATFVIFDDTGLIRPHFSISIMELTDRAGDQAARERARRTLEASPERIRSVAVRVTYEDDAALRMWRRILGDSSAVRLGKGPRNGIDAVIVQGRRSELLRRAEDLGIRLTIE